jgi:hypothetical protein
MEDLIYIRIKNSHQALALKINEVNQLIEDGRKFHIIKIQKSGVLF